MATLGVIKAIHTAVLLSVAALIVLYTTDGAADLDQPAHPARERHRPRTRDRPQRSELVHAGLDAPRKRVVRGRAGGPRS
jgi:hypothetical protein